MAANPPAREPIWELYAFGGLSCAVAGTLTNSIDVAKTRWQLITQVTQQTASSSAAATAAASQPLVAQKPRLFPWIWRQLQSEGVLRFMSRGVTATWLRELSYSSVRMGLYEQLKRAIVDHRTRELQQQQLLQEQEQQHGGVRTSSSFAASASFSSSPSPIALAAPPPPPPPVAVVDVSFAERLACGIFSGLMGAAFSIPCDLARVRMQALVPATLAPPSPPLSVWRVWSDTVRNEGIKGLFRGGATTAARAALLTGTQLATYDRAKHFVALHTGLTEGALLHFGAASLAGFVTVAVTSPFDVLRTRLMRDSAKDSLFGGSFFKCLSATVRQDGIVALWRGAELQWMRIAPHYVITLMTLEWLRKMYGMAPIR